ncbi:hypothetical protein [Bacillus tuaregi]|uniref:hypothetical protein n=1 Tax=Bacillus tuaregi TaxID=1816695 RepID=UPI0008F8D9CB|nr:hypothetical protein [Bacillus tuaregi]
MKGPNDEKWNILKEEADQLLFHQLEFTDQMKEKVRQKSKEGSTKRFFVLTKWKKRMLMMTSAAAVMVLIFISTMTIRNTEKIDSPNELNIFMEEAENSQIAADLPAINNWTLEGLEKVKHSFPEAVLIPTYIPEPFTIGEIHASGPNQGEANQVVITNIFEDQSYLVIIEKLIPGLNESQGFEQVDINGVNGLMRTEDGNDYMDTEVRWVLDDYQYLVIGALSPEEALKVARSFE